MLAQQPFWPIWLSASKEYEWQRLLDDLLLTEWAFGILVAVDEAHGWGQLRCLFLSPSPSTSCCLSSSGGGREILPDADIFALCIDPLAEKARAAEAGMPTVQQEMPSSQLQPSKML